MNDTGNCSKVKEFKTGISGVFFKCLKQIESRIPENDVFNYASAFYEKSGATYLIGRLYNTLNVLSDEYKILGLSEDINNTFNGDFYFDFILWFENGQDIEKVKKLDKRLIVLEVEYPILSIAAYKNRRKFGRYNSYCVHGKMPDFLYTKYFEDEVRDKIYDQFLEYLEYINPLYKKELFDELVEYKKKYHY